MTLTIFADNAVEGGWFRSLDPRLSLAAVRLLMQRGSNPSHIEELIKYDRPDIVLDSDGRPVLVIEKTREVPTGHNVGQRLARLVRSAEMGVPTVKFFPFDARKHGDYSSICHLNIRLLDTFARMTAVHDVPVLAANWRADAAGELIIDADEDAPMRALLASFLDAGMPRWWPLARITLEGMRKEFERRLLARPAYADWPPSVEIVSTDALLRQHDFKVLMPLRNRGESLIYRIEMTSDKCRREDPYTGTQFIYDYIGCRSGPLPENKHRNLLLVFPQIPLQRWRDANPNDSARKSSNWYLTANALVFKDGAEFLRVSD